MVRSVCLLFVLFVVFPACVWGEPGSDNLVLNDCLPDSINVNVLGVKIPISGLPKACVTGTISRCDSLNVSLRITVGNSINQTINISRAGNMNQTFGFPIPTQICTNNAHATLHFDPNIWKFTPSYVRIHPYIHFDTPCRVCPPLGLPCTDIPANLITIGQDFSAGADCSTAKTCSSCANMRQQLDGRHPCGWCQASNTCFPSNNDNQPYCATPCSSMNGLLRTNEQCTAAAQAQSSNDSAWSPGKTATVIILAIVLPILVIVIALCLRRSYNRQRALKGATSGVGSIQAHVQGYRPTSESVSVSTEVSTNASTTAEFRQLEGYNPPSARAPTDSNL